ncbi:hypothetical protein BGZ54_001303 [Gamsiella multidivaricata]|nr:hypothetical protein BGZ54_001303 [Gamsiella multidivaricata]
MSESIPVPPDEGDVNNDAIRESFLRIEEQRHKRFTQDLVTLVKDYGSTIRQDENILISEYITSKLSNETLVRKVAELEQVNSVLRAKLDRPSGSPSNPEGSGSAEGSSAAIYDLEQELKMVTADHVRALDDSEKLRKTCQELELRLRASETIISRFQEAEKQWIASEDQLREQIIQSNQGINELKWRANNLQKISNAKIVEATQLQSKLQGKTEAEIALKAELNTIKDEHQATLNFISEHYSALASAVAQKSGVMRTPSSAPSSLIPTTTSPAQAGMTVTPSTERAHPILTIPTLPSRAIQSALTPPIHSPTDSAHAATPPPSAFQTSGSPFFQAQNQIQSLPPISFSALVTRLEREQSELWTKQRDYVQWFIRQPFSPDKMAEQLKELERKQLQTLQLLHLHHQQQVQQAQLQALQISGHPPGTPQYQQLQDVYSRLLQSLQQNQAGLQVQHQRDHQKIYQETPSQQQSPMQMVYSLINNHVNAKAFNDQWRKVSEEWNATRAQLEVLKAANIPDNLRAAKEFPLERLAEQQLNTMSNLRTQISALAVHLQQQAAVSTSGAPPTSQHIAIQNMDHQPALSTQRASAAPPVSHSSTAGDTVPSVAVPVPVSAPPHVPLSESMMWNGTGSSSPRTITGALGSQTESATRSEVIILDRSPEELVKEPIGASSEQETSTDSQPTSSEGDSPVTVKSKSSLTGGHESLQQSKAEAKESEKDTSHLSAVTTEQHKSTEESEQMEINAPRTETLATVAPDRSLTPPRDRIDATLSLLTAAQEAIEPLPQASIAPQGFSAAPLAISDTSQKAPPEPSPDIATNVPAAKGSDFSAENFRRKIQILTREANVLSLTKGSTSILEKSLALEKKPHHGSDKADVQEPAPVIKAADPHVQSGTAAKDTDNPSPGTLSANKRRLIIDWEDDDDMGGDWFDLTSLEDRHSSDHDSKRELKRMNSDDLLMEEVVATGSAKFNTQKSGHGRWLVSQARLHSQPAIKKRKENDVESKSDDVAPLCPPATPVNRPAPSVAVSSPSLALPPTSLSSSTTTKGSEGTKTTPNAGLEPALSSSKRDGRAPLKNTTAASIGGADQGAAQKSSLVNSASASGYVPSTTNLLFDQTALPSFRKRTVVSTEQSELSATENVSNTSIKEANSVVVNESNEAVPSISTVARPFGQYPDPRLPSARPTDPRLARVQKKTSPVPSMAATTVTTAAALTTTAAGLSPMTVKGTEEPLSVNTAAPESVVHLTGQQSTLSGEQTHRADSGLDSGPNSAFMRSRSKFFFPHVNTNTNTNAKASPPTAKTTMLTFGNDSTKDLAAAATNTDRASQAQGSKALRYSLPKKPISAGNTSEPKLSALGNAGVGHRLSGDQGQTGNNHHGQQRKLTQQDQHQHQQQQQQQNIQQQKRFWQQSQASQQQKQQYQESPLQQRPLHQQQQGHGQKQRQSPQQQDQEQKQQQQQQQKQRQQQHNTILHKERYYR